MVSKALPEGPGSSLITSLNETCHTAAARKTRIIAISSGGGHWVQMLRLRPAFEGCDLTYVTVDEGYRFDVDPDSKFLVIPDATRWNKLALVRSAAQIFLLMLRERPDVVISTGAAPGYFGIRMAKHFRARTIWVDSIANVETLSLSGVKAGKYADLWLTQWPQLARPGGPHYVGNVIA